MVIKKNTVPHKYRNRFLRDGGGTIVINTNANSSSSSGGGGSTTDATAYHLPEGGIPLGDLKSDVQSKLNMAHGHSNKSDLDNLGTVVNTETVNTGALNVSGNAQVGGGITVTGSGSMGSLSVTNGVSAGSVSARSVTASGKVDCSVLEVTDEAVIGGDLDTSCINNSEMITTKDLKVTGTATFFELVIQKIKAAGGSALFTAGDGFRIDAIEADTNSYYLYWRAELDKVATNNMWAIGDLALCKDFKKARTFTTYNVSNTYWWCKVIEVSGANMTTKKMKATSVYLDEEHNYYHWIKISTTVKASGCTVEPKVGDDVAMCGHMQQSNETQAEANARGAAIYIAANNSLDTGLTAPLIAQYKGIKTFELAPYRGTYQDAKGAKFVGNFDITTQDVSDAVDEYLDDNMPTYHTYYAYADSADGGSGFTVNGSYSGSKDYLGICVTTSGTQPSVAGAYTWVKNAGKDGEPGEPGEAGAQGEKGDQGEPGAQGENGKDAIQLVVNPETVTFTTGSNGMVSGSKSVSVMLLKGGVAQAVSGLSCSASDAVNCAVGTISKSGTAFTTQLSVPSGSHSLESVDGESVYFAPTSGSVKFSVVYDGVTYTAVARFQTDVKTSWSNLAVKSNSISARVTGISNTVGDSSSGLVKQVGELSVKSDQISAKVSGLTPFKQNMLVDPLNRTERWGLISGSSQVKTTNVSHGSSNIATKQYCYAPGNAGGVVNPLDENGHVYRFVVETNVENGAGKYTHPKGWGDASDIKKYAVKLQPDTDYVFSVWVAMNTLTEDDVTGFAQFNLYKGLVYSENRVLIAVGKTNKGVSVGAYRQYWVTFNTGKIPKGYVRLNSSTYYSAADYYTDNDFLYFTWFPFLSMVQSSSTTGSVSIAGAQLETGTIPSGWLGKTEGDRLLDTGIDIYDKRIELTTDNFICQNNAGEKTLSLDKKGNLKVSGAVMNTVQTIDPTVAGGNNHLLISKNLNSAGYGRETTKINYYGFTPADNATTSVYCLDVWKCANVINLNNCNKNVYLPYYVMVNDNGYKECSVQTFRLMDDCSTVKQISKSDLLELVGKKLVVYGNNSSGSRLYYGVSMPVDTGDGIWQAASKNDNMGVQLNGTVTVLEFKHGLIDCNGTKHEGFFWYGWNGDAEEIWE